MLYPQLLTTFEGQAVLSARHSDDCHRVRVLPMSGADYERCIVRLKQGEDIRTVFTALDAEDRCYISNGASFEFIGPETTHADAVSKFASKSSRYLTVSQFCRVYRGEISLDDAYEFNRRNLLDRIETTDPAMGF